MMAVHPGRSGWVNQVAQEYGHGRPVTVLFDYDGTLTPIAPHPSQARLAPATRQKLRRLATLPGVRVAVLSGRALPDVKEMVGLDGVYYAGSWGLEIDLLGDTERCPIADEIGRLLEGIHLQLLDLLAKYPGTWMEQKPGAATIHFRGLEPEAARCFGFEVTNLLAVFDELECRLDDEAVEVTPANGWNKGTAVGSIVSHAAADLGRLPVAVYFGDAANDVEGMKSTSDTGGVAIGVGPEAPPIADVVLDDPEELPECLDDLIDQLAAQRGIPDANSAPASRKPAGRGNSPPGLLILDPNSTSRNRLADAMASLGWDVRQAEAPQSAVQMVLENPGTIRVALIDLQLPGLQGSRTAAELLRSDPEVVRCFMSAEIRPYTAVAFGRLSTVPLFPKPISATELDTALRELLSRESAGVE